MQVLILIKKYVSLVTTVVFMVIILCGHTTAFTVKKSDLIKNGFRMCANNSYLQLYVNDKTAEIAVLERMNGVVWYSNPQDINQDILAVEEQKQLLKAQVKVNYLMKNTMYGINSFSSSVEYKNFNISSIKNGVRIDFKMTPKKPVELPFVISEEHFNNMILSKLKDSEKFKIKLYYKSNEVFKEEHSRYPPTDKQNLFGKKYELIREPTVYFTSRGDLSQVPSYLIEEIIKIMDRVGFDKQERMKEISYWSNKYEIDANEDIYIDLPVEYLLDGYNFIAKVNMKEVAYSKNVKINSIEFLNYFGACGKDSRGYIFVPDGSGTLIYLNNKKIRCSPVKLRVYGTDKAIQRLTINTNTQPVSIPVFGIKNQNGAFIAIMENGSENSYINADVAGRYNSYNFVYGEYVITDSDIMKDAVLSAQRNIILNSEKSYEGLIKQRYCFISKKDASYSDMAIEFRNYMVDRGKLPDKITSGNKSIPFYLELIGAINKERSILGISQNALTTLTTFKQAEKILNELESNNIDNICLKYKGWFNGGIKQSMPDKIKVEGKLGGESDLKKLLELINKKNNMLYLDVNFTKIPGKVIYFNPGSNLTKYIFQQNVLLYPFMLSSNAVDYSKQFSLLLKPSISSNLVEEFLKKLYSISYMSGVSLSDFEEINSDFDYNNTKIRYDAVALRIKDLAKIKENTKRIMINSGNYITFPYLSDIINIPVESSGYELTDRDVPFLHILLHGYISYSGCSANINADYRILLLKSLEVGAYPYFTMMYSDDKVVKGTDYSEYASMNYRKWLPRAKEFYTKANEVLSKVQNQVIVRHEEVKEKVYKTTYENGRIVIVNYNNKSVKIDKRVILPYGYSVLEGR